MVIRSVLPADCNDDRTRIADHSRAPAEPSFAAVETQPTDANSVACSISYRLLKHARQPEFKTP